ncbi:MAG: hypothetical protein IRZ03_16405 [Acidobacterium ailaaui]|nr:hypothetical protein [Pseudacidobacterium ailaaui]
MATITVRVDEELLIRLDEIRNQVNVAGLLPVRVTRSDLARIALEKLIEAAQRGELEAFLR